MGFRFYMAFFSPPYSLFIFFFSSVHVIRIGYGCKIQLRGNGFSIFLVANLLFFTVPSSSNFNFFYSNIAFDSCITKAKAACKFGFKKGEMLWSFSLHFFSQHRRHRTDLTICASFFFVHFLRLVHRISWNRLNLHSNCVERLIFFI